MAGEVGALWAERILVGAEDEQVVVVQHVPAHGPGVDVGLALALVHLQLDRDRAVLAQKLLGQFRVCLAHARVLQVVVRQAFIGPGDAGLKRRLLGVDLLGLLERLDRPIQAGRVVQVLGDPSCGFAEGRLPCGKVATNSVVSDGSFTVTVRPEARNRLFSSSSSRAQVLISSLDCGVEIFPVWFIFHISNKIGLNEAIAKRQAVLELTHFRGRLLV